MNNFWLAWKLRC